MNEVFSAKLAMTLLHSLWQGVAVVAVAAIWLRVLSKSSANSRYLVACCAMFCLPVLAALTFAYVQMPAEMLTDTTVVKVTQDESVIENELRDAEAAELKARIPGANLPGLPTASGVDAPLTVQPSVAVESELVAGDEPSQTNETQPASMSAVVVRLVKPFVPWLSVIYLTGVVVMLARLLLGTWGGFRLRGRSVLASDADLLSMVADVSKKIGLRVAPAVYYCERIVVPVVIGVFKPAILLPASLATNLSPTELSAILSHELAHIRRFDLTVQLIQKLVESLLFFHPAVWWLSRQVDNERENCCDDLAAAVGSGNLGYAAALLKIAERCLPASSSDFAPAVATLSADGSNSRQLSRRIERQLKLSGNALTPSRPLPAGALLFALLMVAMLVGLAVAAGSAGDSNKGPAVTESAETESRAIESVRSKGADMGSIQEAVQDFNAENKAREIGMDQPPVTVDEVLAAIKNCERVEDAPRLNEQEFATLKEIAATGQLPEGAYFRVYRSQQVAPFVVSHFWDVNLFLPAIGHDGFVGFTIRNTPFADEKIDPANVAWGEPDADGMSLGIYLSPRKASYQKGERVRLRLLVRNDGTIGVPAAFANTSHPGPADFEITDEDGNEVAVENGHIDWRIPWISGFMGGGLAAGDTHAFNVPYEIRIGKDADVETNPLIGRVIDAKVGQTLSMKVRSPNGNASWKDSSMPQSGVIKFTLEGVKQIGGEEMPPVPATVSNRKEKIDPADVAWGKPDKDSGLTVGVYLSPKKASYQLGERVQLRYLVRNDGTQANTSFSEASFEPMPVDFEVVDEQGKKATVSIGHQDWATRHSSSLHEHTTAVGELHELYVPFELQIGSAGQKETHKTVGRVVEARAGQTLSLKLKIRTAEGGNVYSDDDDVSLPETGAITFSVAAKEAAATVVGEPAGDDLHAENEDMNQTTQFLHREVDIRGKTLDASGQPVDGAIVYLVSTYTPRANDKFRVIATAVSNIQGDYVFSKVDLPTGNADDGVPDNNLGTFEILATAKGYGLAWAPNQDMDHRDHLEVNLQLTKPATMQGRVVDEAGEPMAGVEIRLTNCTRLREAQPPLFSDELTSVFQDAAPKSLTRRETDADGRFEFTDLPHTAQLRFIARAEGYARESRSAAALDNPGLYATKPLINDGIINFSMRRIKKVPIRVVYADTKLPADRVLISAGGNGTSNYVTTDAEGRGELNLPVGEYNNVILYPRIGTRYLRTKETNSLSVVADDQAVPSFEIQPASGLEISVVDAKTHKPIPDVRLEVNGLEHGWRCWEVETNVSHYTEPKSDAKGKMSALVEPGVHRIGVRSRELDNKYELSNAAIEVDCPASKTQTIVIEVEPIEPESNEK